MKRNAALAMLLLVPTILQADDFGIVGKLNPVYHGEAGVRTLKELTRSYLTITRDLTRVMKFLVPIPPETASDLKQQKENGLGYQVVSVQLKYGRHLDQVVASEGCILAVRDYTEIPVEFDEVATVKVNHKRWNFRDWSDKGQHRSKNKAATA
jgi:hypothetical protein